MVEAILIGAGGFGRELLDVVEAHNMFHGPHSNEHIRIMGIADDAPSQVNLDRLADRGYVHLGDLNDVLKRNPVGAYLLGVGNPEIKRRIAERLENTDWRPLTVVHPKAVIGSKCEIGEGSIICGGVQLSTNTRLGRHVHLNPNATIGHDAVLADFVSVNPGAIVSGEVVVGARTLIGAGAVVLQELSIGEDALIGAGACVTRSVAGATTVAGVPARPMQNLSSPDSANREGIVNDA